MFGILKFYLDLESAETRSFYFLLIAKDRNKLKKNPEHAFVDIGK